MGVIEKDPKGTNVRKTPGGAIVKTLPGISKTDEEKEMRAVIVTEQNGQWLRVHLSDESLGWMHGSVLGTCASATEDGNPTMYVKPEGDSAVVAKVKDGTPLRLLEMRDGWAKVETTSSGARKSGWIMEHTLFFNEYNNCWAR